jgi:hypothetical protein
VAACRTREHAARRSSERCRWRHAFISAVLDVPDLRLRGLGRAPHQQDSVRAALVDTTHAMAAASASMSTVLRPCTSWPKRRWSHDRRLPMRTSLGRQCRARVSSSTPASLQAAPPASMREIQQKRRGGGEDWSEGEASEPMAPVAPFD